MDFTSLDPYNAGIAIGILIGLAVSAAVGYMVITVERWRGLKAVRALAARFVSPTDPDRQDQIEGVTDEGMAELEAERTRHVARVDEIIAAHRAE